MSGVQKTVLSNGVRVLTESVGHVGSASIGLWCRTGSVNENDNEGGITHFIEHMLFKGTAKRTAKQIAEEIEGRGGMLNAFTDKEQTCYYTRVLADDAEVAVDVLADMVRNSLLDAEELEREKGVVLEEIKRGEDEPGDHVHDLHVQGLWGKHPLGLPIIGTPESVSSFDRDDLSAYIGRRYHAGTILIAAAGNIRHDDFVRWADGHFGDLSPGETAATPDRPGAQAGDNLVGKEVEQVHFCIGGPGTSVYDDDLYPLYVLDGVLGSGMSSRLFQEIRERRGLAYSVGSYTMSYSSGGAFTVYGGTSPQHWPVVQDLVRKEFDKISGSPVPADELAKVKRSLSGTLALSLEAMSPRMMRMARNEFLHGRVIPLEETLSKIEAVTAEQIQALATQILGPEQIRTTAIGPFGA